MSKTLRFILSHPLNANGKKAAIGRFLKWQAASRLMRTPIALPFVEDAQLFATKGMTGATGNWYCGLHEYAEMAFVLHFTREDDLVLDVGANIGSYTVLAAGPARGRVIAVEPVPSTFRCLQRNVVLNELQDRVELHCMGVSQEAGELRFTSGLDTVNHVMAEGETGPSVTVPVRPLDELLRDRAPMLMKIDVEGHEASVLAGARNTLADPRLQAVLMEINGSGARYGIEDDALLEAMAQNGFSPYSYDPVPRKLRPWSSEADNAIFVRNREFAEQRVAGSRRYRLVNGEI